MKETPQFLIRIPSSGSPEVISLPEDAHPDHALLAAYLHTDVTERLRLAATPAFLSGDDADSGETVLCYFIDARGGEKQQPVNFLGTCFYHTGCPIHGDLLLLCCDRQDPEGEARCFTESEAAQVLNWLKEEFGGISAAL